MAELPAVVLTRPIAQSHLWSNALERVGYKVLVWPLIELQAHTDLMRTSAVLSAWHGYQAVMFVSPAAVQHTFQRQLPKAGWGLTRCWATGPGTRQALLEAGVPAGLIDSPPVNAQQFDTEALWQEVQHKISLDRAVLVLRGSDSSHPESADEGVGRDWLIKQLEAAGVRVDSVAVYQRQIPVWDAPQKELARKAALDGSIWLFSSSQSLVHLANLLPEQDWQHGKALTTHDRIADKAQAMGFGWVKICKPSLADVIASLEYLE